MNVTQANVAGADVVQAGNGPDLLLLHSLLAERSVFDRVLPDLATDFRVSLPTCRATAARRRWNLIIPPSPITPIALPR